MAWILKNECSMKLNGNKNKIQLEPPQQSAAEYALRFQCPVLAYKTTFLAKYLSNEKNSINPFWRKTFSLINFFGCPNQKLVQ